MSFIYRDIYKVTFILSYTAKHLWSFMILREMTCLSIISAFTFTFSLFDLDFPFIDLVLLLLKFLSKLLPLVSIFMVEIEIFLLAFLWSFLFSTNTTISSKFNFMFLEELLIVVTRFSQLYSNEDKSNNDLFLSSNMMPKYHNYFVTMLKLLKCLAIELSSTNFLLENFLIEKIFSKAKAFSYILASKNEINLLI